MQLALAERRDPALVELRIDVGEALKGHIRKADQNKPGRAADQIRGQIVLGKLHKTLRDCDGVLPRKMKYCGWALIQTTRSMT
jgi:hypothetical protein